MKKGKMVLALIALCFMAFSITGCDWFAPKEEKGTTQEEQIIEEQTQPLDEEVQETEIEETEEVEEQ